jgi:hypothetical protein
MKARISIIMMRARLGVKGPYIFCMVKGHLLFYVEEDAKSFMGLESCLGSYREWGPHLARDCHHARSYNDQN